MCPQLWPGRAQGSWQTLLELFTAPSCCLLLVHPQLQTSLRCSFHLSLSPFPQNISLQTVQWISTGVQEVCTSSHVCPTAWNQPGLAMCPTLLPVPCSATACVQLPAAAGVPWHGWQVLAHRSKCSRAAHSPSPLLCWHLAVALHLRLPLLCISRLLGCSPSLSFLWAVTSTSMKHWCLSKGKILGSHFLSKHSC